MNPVVLILLFLFLSQSGSPLTSLASPLPPLPPAPPKPPPRVSLQDPGTLSTRIATALNLPGNTTMASATPSTSQAPIDFNHASDIQARVKLSS
jgi:hypothetical protein